MSEDTSQEEQRSYEARENDKKQYLSIGAEQQGLHDKYIFIIAAGLYNLMIIFIEKIVPLEKAICIQLFNYSLLFLAKAVCAVLLSFFLSAKEAHRAYEKVNNGENYCAGESITARTIPILNLITCTLTIVAILFTTIFVALNIQKKNTDYQNQNSSQESTEKTSQPKEPHSEE